MNEYTLQRVLEKLVDRLIGEDVLPEDRMALVDDGFQILMSESEDGDRDYSDYYAIRDIVYGDLQRENPEAAMQFMNTSSKLFSDFESQNGYLKRPGEAIEMLRNIAVFLRQQEQELQEISEQRNSLDNMRYLQSVPDRFPGQQSNQAQNSLNNNNDFDSNTLPEHYRQQQQANDEGEYYRTNQDNDADDMTEAKDPERMSFAEILWSSHRFQSPSNRQILKDLPYTLQGISSTAFTWVDPLPLDDNTGRQNRKPLPRARHAMRQPGDNNSRNSTPRVTEDDEEDLDDNDEQTTTVLALPLGLPWPVLGVLNQLMEPAVLYRNIKEILKRREEDSNSGGVHGLVVQALDSEIERELRGYLALVGVIETEVRRQEMSMHNQLHNQQNPNMNTFSSRQSRYSSASARPHGRGNSTLPTEAYSYGIGGKITLARSIVLLQDATQGLRLIHTILGESAQLVGGQLLSLIHSYTYNGDQFVSKFATRILPKVVKPFFDILNKWVLCGQLVDPHHEFFVRKGHRASNSPAITSLWEGNFFLEYKYLPDYIPKRIAEQIFQIGKTLHFIATACDDREWVDRRKSECELDPSVLYNLELLQEQVSIAYKQVVRHLNDILRTKFHLSSHLRGLKDYLLLGKGDFVQLLVETVAPVLDRPAVQLFRHHLTATLDTAIRGSNATLDHPDVLRALDARMLELGHGDIGWDVFTLDYRVDMPLDTVILDRKSMTEYLRVFNFLWRIKRVSFTLNSTWRQMTSTERLATSNAYLKHPSMTRYVHNKQQYSGVSSMGYHTTMYDLYPQSVRKTWKIVRLVCGEMLHFVSELEYYINYEVIEMAWGELINKIQNGELSVDELISVHKEYLQKITYKGLLGGGDLLMGELHDVLKTVLAFGITTEGLHDVSERLRAAEAANDGEILSQNSAELSKRAKKIDYTIRELRVKFEQSVKRLVTALDKEEDSEMRFLSVRLDFNGFYSRLNPISSSSGQSRDEEAMMNSNNAGASTSSSISAGYVDSMLPRSRVVSGID